MRTGGHESRPFFVTATLAAPPVSFPAPAWRQVVVASQLPAVVAVLLPRAAAALAPQAVAEASRPRVVVAAVRAAHAAVPPAQALEAPAV
jgi:hypothetical protein